MHDSGIMHYIFGKQRYLSLFQFFILVIIAIALYSHAIDIMNTNAQSDLILTNALNGSGTGWLPQSSVIYGIHQTVGKWAVMNHGSLYLRLDQPHTCTDLPLT